jgi:hypothetical protein
MTNSQSISEYLTEFDQNWSRLKQRVLNSSNDDKLAQGLNVFLDSDTVKSSFLLLSLPESLSTQVDNLLLRKDLTYNDAYSALLDLPSSTPSNAKALAAKAMKSKGKEKDQASSGSVTKNECSFCKKHKRDFQGHTYKNCLILKQLKDGTNNNISNQSHLPPQPTGTANLVTPTISTTNSDPENESYGIAYIASSSQAFINTPPSALLFQHNIIHSRYGFLTLVHPITSPLTSPFSTPQFRIEKE